MRLLCRCFRFLPPPLCSSNTNLSCTAKGLGASRLFLVPLPSAEDDSDQLRFFPLAAANNFTGSASCLCTGKSCSIVGLGMRYVSSKLNRADVSVFSAKGSAEELPKMDGEPRPCRPDAFMFVEACVVWVTRLRTSSCLTGCGSFRSRALSNVFSISAASDRILLLLGGVGVGPNVSSCFFARKPYCRGVAGACMCVRWRPSPIGLPTGYEFLKAPTCIECTGRWRVFFAAKAARSSRWLRCTSLKFLKLGLRAAGTLKGSCA